MLRWNEGTANQYGLNLKIDKTIIEAQTNATGVLEKEGAIYHPIIKHTHGGFLITLFFFVKVVMKKKKDMNSGIKVLRDYYSM